MNVSPLSNLVVFCNLVESWYRWRQSILCSMFKYRKSLLLLSIEYLLSYNRKGDLMASLGRDALESNTSASFINLVRERTRYHDSYGTYIILFVFAVLLCSPEFKNS